MQSIHPAEPRTIAPNSPVPPRRRQPAGFWLRLALVVVGVIAVLVVAKANRNSRRATEGPAIARYNLPARVGPILPLATELAFSTLRFVDPTYITPLPDGSGRLAVLERPGRIWVFENRPDAAEKTLWLDISPQTMKVENKAEDGLFCIAFHPQFAQAGSLHEGEFFLHYTADRDGKRFNRLSKFVVPPGSDRPDPASEIILIDTPEQNQSHNGGSVFFGPDGFLYVTIGDDGRRHPNPHAQYIDRDLFSGILRIDVDCQGEGVSHPPPRQPVKGCTTGYFIPDDNPFVGVPGALEEFYVIGLRNPWRASFDWATGKLWVSDVGERRREEINIVQSGANCGWAYTEGSVPTSGYEPKALPRPEPYLGHETPPVLEYERDAMHRCVIGGYVYRGSQFPELRGKYIYADQSGRIYALEVDGQNKLIANTLIAVVAEPGLGLSSFGEDPDGELFICIIKDLTVENGEIHKLTRTRRLPEHQLPARLSETGVFADLKQLQPQPEFTPFEVNQPLWSDRALKRRWISLPPGQKIEGPLAGPWQFPAGTVFIKHFDLPLDEANTGREATTKRRLETRLVVRDDLGGVYAATYRWDPVGTEAYLVNHPVKEEIEYVDIDGWPQRQTWLFPGRFECMTCHNAPAGYVLGFTPKQLNGAACNAGDSTSDAQKNQMLQFAAAGMFAAPCTEVELNNTPRLASLDDPQASLQDRVRSYLDANCSACHQPGHRFGAWDARFETPLVSQGIVDGVAHMHKSESRDAKVVRPGDLEHSYLLRRLESNETFMKMPPLARNVVDRRAVELVTEWIQSLPPTVAAEENAAPDGTAPDGAAPDGAAPDGAVQATYDQKPDSED